MLRKMKIRLLVNLCKIKANANDVRFTANLLLILKTHIAQLLSYRKD